MKISSIMLKKRTKHYALEDYLGYHSRFPARHAAVGLPASSESGFIFFLDNKRV